MDELWQEGERSENGQETEPTAMNSTWFRSFFINLIIIIFPPKYQRIKGKTVQT